MKLPYSINTHFYLASGDQFAKNLNNTRSLPLEQMTEMPINGNPFIGYRFKADSSDEATASFVFTIANESAFLNFFNLAFQLGIELVVAIAVAVLLSLYLSNNITKPLRTLGMAAKRIQRGDYHSPIPAFDTAEVSSLSQAFVGMQDSIQAREAEINQLAYYDSLTGLPNRNSFIKQLEQRIDSKPEQAFVVLMLDIDRFKEINDTIGPPSR